MVPSKVVSILGLLTQSGIIVAFILVSHSVRYMVKVCLTAIHSTIVKIIVVDVEASLKNANWTELLVLILMSIFITEFIVCKMVNLDLSRFIIGLFELFNCVPLVVKYLLQLEPDLVNVFGLIPNRLGHSQIDLRFFDNKLKLVEGVKGWRWS